MHSITCKNPHGKTYKSILKKFKAITKCPVDFLSIQRLKSEDIQTLLKDTYNLTMLKDTRNKSNIEILPELVLEDLDEEQVWQLIDLRNNFVWSQFLENTSKLLSLQEAKLQISYARGGRTKISDEDEDENEQASFEEESDLEVVDENKVESEEEYKTNKTPKKKGKPSIVDDKFFKLNEMEAFLNAEDEKELKKQNRKSVEDDFSINYFDENLDDEEEENVGYRDFFDDDVEDEPRKMKQVKGEEREEEENRIGRSDINEEQNDNQNKNLYNNGTGSVSDNSDNNSETENEIDKPKSSFEERQERLNQRIKDYEQEILGEKPWQLKGEVQATNRPQNSLLEEILEFEATTRPCPIITEETTIRLEDIIRQRIKDQAWDDVELKVKPLKTPQEYRKQLILDQEKSKESLAQIYEKQYQKEIEKLDPNAADAKEEEPKSHKEIKEMMRSLFVKLDALSNFHFTPKPVAPEPKIITNTPAVNMEEVAPVAVSNAKLLAPEEIRKRAKGDILGSNERNKTDKNRDRRHKKQKQRAIHKALEERDIQKQKLGIKLSKKEEQAKATKNLTKSRNVEKVSISNDAGPIKSSKAFFSKLQETTSIQNKNIKKQKKSDSDTNTLSAKKLKFIQRLKSEDIQTLLKDTYNLTMLKDTRNKSNIEILPELVLEDLDEEQVWQLIDLRNNFVWSQFLENTSKLLSLQEAKLQISYARGGRTKISDEDEDENEQASFEEESDLEVVDENKVESEEEYKTNKTPKKKGKPSIVDDKFFKLNEMEAFLNAEDEKELKKQNRKSVEDDFSINYFDENLDDEEEENVGYRDFFDDDVEDEPRKMKQVKGEEREEEENRIGRSDINEEQNDNQNKNLYNNGTGSVSDNSDNNSETENEIDKPKSSFEERQERLNQRIKDYEQEILGEKPWQLKGEVQATNRPQNSLLEEILEFEATTRPCPIITEETTIRLEDIIRQRIKDQAWDDVELKVKPLKTPQEYRKQLILDQEKSKESLAQIYEKQYQKEIEKLDPNAADANEEEPKSHKEIKEMMRSLFVKLDALSNFHFTPKPVAPEPKIITNTPAVNMEEVAPVAVSNAKLLAPEEIRKRAKGDILGSNERNKTDKNRDRRHKKQKQRAIHKALEERDIRKQKLGIKLSKKEEQAKATKNLTKSRNVEKVSISNDAGPIKSSKAFFSKLQETTSIQNKNIKKQKKSDSDTNTLSAKKLKL